MDHEPAGRPKLDDFLPFYISVSFPVTLFFLFFSASHQPQVEKCHNSLGHRGFQRRAHPPPVEALIRPLLRPGSLLTGGESPESVPD